MEQALPPISPSDPNFLKGTLVLEAGEDQGRLLSKIENFWFGPGAARQKMVVACAPGQKAGISLLLSSGYFSSIEIVEVKTLENLLSFVSTSQFAYLPAAAVYSPLIWEDQTPGLRPWVPKIISLAGRGPRLGSPVSGWIADTNGLSGGWGGQKLPALRDFETIARTQNLALAYGSSLAVAAAPSPAAAAETCPLDRQSKILAVIPHFQCEEWLEGCLRSLVEQTRSLDGILVLDDGSVHPPRGIVEKFKSVTLWRASKNVGPYRLIQSAIEKTRYDGYFFQDADDWSSLDRLELQLAEAERTGAEMVGAQELMYLKDNVFPNCYPVRVNQDLKTAPSYALLHPASLVSRGLIFRVGGYATGLRFSGDMEFLMRACLMGKAVNLERFCYFRRIRVNSLITSAETGLSSPARAVLDGRMKARFRDNIQRLEQGKDPDLTPLESGEPIDFEKICGPELSLI